MDIRIHTVNVSHEADEVTYHEKCLKINIDHYIFLHMNTYIWLKICSFIVVCMLICYSLYVMYMT